MASEKNIQMKHFNGIDWDSLYPRTKAEVVMLNEQNVATILGSLANSLETKVDVVSGKGLSTNDYTTTEKNKLSGLPSSVYSKSEVDGIVGNIDGGGSTEIEVSDSTPVDANIKLWFEEI